MGWETGGTYAGVGWTLDGVNVVGWETGWKVGWGWKVGTEGCTGAGVGWKLGVGWYTGCCWYISFTYYNLKYIWVYFNL